MMLSHPQPELPPPKKPPPQPQLSPLLPQQDKRIRIQIQEPHPLLVAQVLLHPQ